MSITYILIGILIVKKIRLLAFYAKYYNLVSQI